MSLFYQDSHVTILHGDCREILPHLAVGSVHTCVTSPPYFGLRDYGGQAQIGLEETPQAYVLEQRNVFDAVRKVLRQDGTCWLNLGDSYCSTAPGTMNGTGTGLQSNPGRISYRPDYRPDGLKPKDLMGIPWRVAFALQEAGWYLRSDIIWAKANCMPESVTDRPTKAHEYLFLLAKAERYYYDAEAIKEPASYFRPAGLGSRADNDRDPKHGTRKQDAVGKRQYEGFNDRWKDKPVDGRNKRTVWNVATAPYGGAHFAVFPEKLIEPCILAGCPAQVCAVCAAPWQRIVEKGETTWQARKAGGAKGGAAHFALGRGQRETHGNGASHDLGGTPSVTLGWQPSCDCNADTIPGTVLDPFGGSGTTARVAKRLGRRCILIEQNEQYAEMAAASLSQNVFDLEAI